MNQKNQKGKTLEPQVQPGAEGLLRTSWPRRKRQPEQLGSRCFSQAMLRTSLRLERGKGPGELRWRRAASSSRPQLKLTFICAQELYQYIKSKKVS